MYNLYYKLDDSGAWKLYGAYRNESEAFESAKDCLNDGYIIKLEEE